MRPLIPQIIKATQANPKAQLNAPASGTPVDAANNPLAALGLTPEMLQALAQGSTPQAEAKPSSMPAPMPTVIHRPNPTPTPTPLAFSPPQNQYAPINSPAAAYPAPYASNSAAGWVQQLGTQTRMAPNGMVQLNYPLVEQIVAFREAALPSLYQLMSQTQNILTMCEALYAAQRLAENRVNGVNQLYGVTQFWHNNAHPLVQIYLSGFYRKLNAPETFGPLMTMLVRNALQAGPPIPGAFNPQEEIGGAVLDLIANKAAEKMRQPSP